MSPSSDFWKSVLSFKLFAVHMQSWKWATIVLVLWLFFHFLDHWKDYVSSLAETWCTNVLDLKKLSLVYTHKTIAMTLSDILVGEGEGLVLMELNAYY